MTKTIEVSDEMYDKLIELATEMTTQDPRGTRMPHMFQIRDWKKVYDAELNGDVSIFLDRGYGIEIETVEELIDYLKSHFLMIYWQYCLFLNRKKYLYLKIQLNQMR